MRLVRFSYGSVGELEAGRQEIYRLAAASLAAAQAAQARVQAAGQAQNLCAEGARLVATLVQFTQPMNAAGQRVDYDRRATQTYGSTICQMTQVAQQWWSAGDRTKAHNLAYNARQFAPYLENAAVDGRQYAEQAAQWAQQAQAANARLGQIVSALNQLAAGAGSGAGDADMQRARVLADAGVRRQADALGLVNQANGRRQQIASLVQTAGGDPDGLLANADQWLARLAPAQAAIANAVQQINANGNVVVGNWTLVRSSDAAVQNSVRGCSGLAASPINDLLASAATIDAEYRALLSAYSGAQQCRTAAGAIEAAATGGTGGGAVTGGAAGGETSTGVGPTGSRQGGAAAGAGGGAAGGGGGAGTRCPDGSIALLGICSGGR